MEPWAVESRSHLPLAGWEQLVELADAALYWVKENGRNGWSALGPAPDGDLARWLKNCTRAPKL